MFLSFVTVFCSICSTQSVFLKSNPLELQSAYETPQERAGNRVLPTSEVWTEAFPRGQHYS